MTASALVHHGAKEQVKAAFDEIADKIDQGHSYV
jgi:hypothetical protein